MSATLDLSLLVEPNAWAEEYFERLVRAGRQRSIVRGMPYSISSGFLVELAKAQNFHCVVSGLAFKPPAWGRRGRREPFSASIDRIDNARGYEPDNVRLVCLIVNLARSNFDDAALITMARAIAGRAA